MSDHGVVGGQRVDPRLTARAREFRRTMTPEERVLWNMLRDSQIHGVRVRRQQVIDGFIADFYCHAAKLVIEVDGPIHDDQLERDAFRDEVFVQRGLHVLHITNHQIRSDLFGVMKRIQDEVLARSNKHID
jgi:very-short-patch-repair endonuclease